MSNHLSSDKAPKLKTIKASQLVQEEEIKQRKKKQKRERNRLKRERKEKEKKDQNNCEKTMIQAEDNIDDIFTPRDCLSDLDQYDRGVELFKQFCIGKVSRKPGLRSNHRYLIIDTSFTPPTKRQRPGSATVKVVLETQLRLSLTAIDKATIDYKSSVWAVCTFGR